MWLKLLARVGGHENGGDVVVVKESQECRWGVNDVAVEEEKGSCDDGDALGVDVHDELLAQAIIASSVM